MGELIKLQAPTRIDIGICTFRRPGLEDTLLSLFALRVPEGVRIRLIVADNDAGPSARSLVDGLRQQSPFQIAYVHCPKSNISIARNACLAECDADYLAFIDDDETASPQWLAELLKVARETGAAAVLGPVRSLYDAEAPDWMRRGDFHSTMPVWVGKTIRTGYTCNVLLDMRSPDVEARRFSRALGQSGGEDTQFFSDIFESGGIIAFAEGALVYEPVPATRASLNWLVKRRFRFGQTHGRILAEKSSSFSVLKHAIVAGLKAAYCAVFTAATCFSPVRRNRNFLRGVLHVGTLSGVLGIREIRQYGTAEAA